MYLMPKTATWTPFRGLLFQLFHTLPDFVSVPKKNIKQVFNELVIFEKKKERVLAYFYTFYFRMFFNMKENF